MEDFNEIEMIISLQENGPSHINNLLKTVKCDTQKNNILSFEKLYITDKDLFEDGLVKYVEYLKNDDSVLFVSLLETLTDDEIIKYLNIITKQAGIQLYTEFNRIELLKKLLTSCKIREMLSVNRAIWGSLFGLLLSNIKVSDEKWEINLHTLQKIIKSLITKNKNTMNTFIWWVSETTNACISKINIDVLNYNYRLPSDYFLANLLGILMIFWNEGISNDKLKLINYDYIISDKCNIKWIDKKITNDTKEYNFLTQCMFLILNTIRVGYVPILYRSIKWVKILENIENEMREIDTTNPLYNLIINSMKGQKKIIEDYVKTDTDIIKNHSLKTWVNTFYHQLFTWININKNKQLDDILVDMIFYLINVNKHEHHYTYKNDTYNFVLDIIDSKDYTSNIDIKCEFMKFFSEVLMKYVSNIRNSKCIEKIMNKFAVTIISLYNEIHNSQMRYDYKFQNKTKIYGAIESYYTNTKHQSILINKMRNNCHLTKKFINSIFMDLSDVSEVIDNLYEKIYNDDSDDETGHDIGELCSGVYSTFTFYLNVIIFSDKIIDLLLSNDEEEINENKDNTQNMEIAKTILSKEIINTIIMILNLSINKLYTQINYDEELNLGEYDGDTYISLDEYKSAIVNIFNNIYKIGFDMKTVIEDNSFDIKYYSEFNSQTDGDFENIITELYKKMEELENVKEIDMNDAPDEFVDPITYTLIQEPCLLPGMVGFSDTDVYFDKSTILKQLMIKEENPYTRASLNIKDFEDFNESPHIKEKNDALLCKINEWKSKNI